MSEEARWVRICVDTLEHPVIGVKRRAYSRAEAWLWLISKAAWKPHQFRNNGKSMMLDAGQLPAGREYLAKTWRWTPQMVRTFLSELASEGMIEISQSKGHFANVVTICNYAKYQTDFKTKDQSNNQSATSQQPVNNQTYTRDTNTPVDNNKPQQPEPSRERPAAAQGKVNSNELHAKLIEAANGSLCPMAKGVQLNVVSDPLGWIHAGADLELDILPAVRHVAEHTPAGTVRSWRYFASAVSQNKACRERGLPEAPNNVTPISSKRAEKQAKDIEFKAMLDAMVEGSAS